jgi:Bacterial regulatory helix-turn-helix protein, lysR family
VELRQLEYFVAVVEERNFTRAAKRLHVVQSAVSAGVSRLEHEFGTILFDRDPTYRPAPAHHRRLAPSPRRLVKSPQLLNRTGHGRGEGITIVDEHHHERSCPDVVASPKLVPSSNRGVARRRSVEIAR